MYAFPFSRPLVKAVFPLRTCYDADLAVQPGGALPLLCEKLLSSVRSLLGPIQRKASQSFRYAAGPAHISTQAIRFSRCSK